MASAAQIRWMFRSDVDMVEQMRRSCFSESRRDLERVLTSPACILKVAEIEGRVAGFINYKNSKRKIKIVEFAVLPEFRRMGIASDLIRSLLSKASESSKYVEALVPERNLEAQMLLKKCGLKASIAKDASSYRFVSEKCQKESS